MPCIQQSAVWLVNFGLGLFTLLDACSKPPRAAVAAVNRWDRQSDRRTPDRYLDPAPHTMRAASINSVSTPEAIRLAWIIKSDTKKCANA